MKLLVQLVLLCILWGSSVWAVEKDYFEKLNSKDSTQLSDSQDTGSNGAKDADFRDRMKKDDFDPARDTLGILLKLAFVLALFIAMVVLLRRLQKNRWISQNKGSGIEVLESAIIGSNQKIMIVKVYEQVMILGVSGDQINFLQNLSTESEGLMEEADQTPKEFVKGVDQLLARFRRKKDGES